MLCLLFCYTEDDFPPHYWSTLDALSQILEPFHNATDQCQQDKATLYTFHNAFNEMKNEMLKKVILQIYIYTHSQTHINVFYVNQN